MKEILLTITVAFGLVGAIWAGLNKGVTALYKGISILTEIREQTRLNGITLEALKIFDSEVMTRLDKLERSVSDIEQYLVQLSASIEQESGLHAFRIRGNNRH